VTPQNSSKPKPTTGLPMAPPRGPRLYGLAGEVHLNNLTPPKEILQPSQTETEPNNPKEKKNPRYTHIHHVPCIHALAKPNSKIDSYPNPPVGPEPSTIMLTLWLD